jgi:hypothetical protein
MKKMPTGNPRVFVSTAPFAEGNEFPLEMLRANGIDFNVNTLKRKLTEIELISLSPPRRLWRSAFGANHDYR